jgi:8-oxo-dGTP pyrophosphatase MutT (NUDIX family)
MIVNPTPPNVSPSMEVSACFIEYGTQFLLLLRQDHKPQGNTWGMPAGKHKPEELSVNGVVSIDAVVREVEEETGIILHPGTMDFFRSVNVRYPTFDFVYHMFSERFDGRPGVRIDLDDSKESRWVTPEQSLLLPLIPDEDACIKMFYRL